MFWSILDELILPVGEFGNDSDEMRRITRGWHRAIAALAVEGDDVLVDELWTHRWWLEDWRAVLKDFRWWSVLLTASAATLAERERRRGVDPQGWQMETCGSGPSRLSSIWSSTPLI